MYARIGGNRKFWKNVEVTAVEINPKIAKIYRDFFPEDKIVVGNAHEYLLKHFEEFDFIWSSPPCPSHSIVRKNIGVNSGIANPIFPDMKLYEKILFLKHYFKEKWVVENVKSFYEPLIKPYELQRHYFWTNFCVFPHPKINKLSADKISDGTVSFWEKRFGFDLSNYINVDKSNMLRNCVHPILGLYIFECAFKEKQLKLNKNYF